MFLFQHLKNYIFHYHSVTQTYELPADTERAKIWFNVNVTDIIELVGAAPPDDREYGEIVTLNIEPIKVLKITSINFVSR